MEKVEQAEKVVVGVADSFSRACSHKGINNESKVDKRQKDNIKFIIACKNTAKSFETAKEPLDLITLFVQLFIIVPRIFAVAFWRNDRYIAEFLRQSPCLVSFIGPVHQKINRMVSRTELPQKGAPFRSIAAVSCGQRKYYPIPVRCGDHMKLGVPSAPRLSDGLRAVFFKAPVPSGCTLIQVESRLTTFTWIWMIPICCKRTNASCNTPFLAQRFTRT